MANPENSKETEAENSKLKARIKELEEKLATKQPVQEKRASNRQEAQDLVIDLPRHAGEELSNLARAWTNVMIEQAQAGIEIWSSIADSILGPMSAEGKAGRSKPHSPKTEGQPPADIARTTADRIAEGVTGAIHGAAVGAHKALEIPRRVSSRFSETYESHTPAKESES